MSFKICVVGCGNMSVDGHGPSYRRYAVQHPDVELAACCDLDENKAVFYQKEFGFSRHYTDIDTMLDTEKPQAVCLIAPVNRTCALSIKILEKGYPLLLEKPPGINKKETLDMIRAAKCKNIPNQVAFNRRYMPLARRLKDLLVKYPGMDKTMNIQYQMLRVGRKDIDFSTTAIHGIDLVRFIAASDYKSVHFRYQELSVAGLNVANIFMDCEFESGSQARLSFCPVSGTDVERLEINTYNHTYYLNLPIWGSRDIPGLLLHDENNKTELSITGDGVSGSEEIYVLNGFYGENEVFFDDICNGRLPEGDMESGLQSVEIAECIRNRVPLYER